MLPSPFKKVTLLLTFVAGAVTPQTSVPQYPQGYYPFEESPAKIPPKVRKPPYLQTQVRCPGSYGTSNEQTLDNLCGDLNKGYLPLNPMGQNVEGVSYPFELMKTQALAFFSKTLPILKADDTLPKVAKYESDHISYHKTIFDSKPHTKVDFYHHRTKRDEASSAAAAFKEAISSSTHLLTNKDYQQKANRQSRGWCKDSHGVFCMLYNVFKGKDNNAADRSGDDSAPSTNSLESPMTPCPSAVEYVTPVFAKNYQGVWRYVVQIPYEGYFTQTVEVVKCLSTKCELLEGSCLASPRWVSLLVAEIFYPYVSFPSGGKPQSNRPPVEGSNPPGDSSRFASRQGGSQDGGGEENCDGQDELGCYQVRLYYDWFLIPGSCKCWKQDFFDQFLEGDNRKK